MAKEFSMQCSPPPPMLYLGAQYAGLATLSSTSEVFLLYRLFSRFSLDDLTASFEGDFKQQATVNSNWLPLGGAAVPIPRPGRCHNSSSTLPESSLHFIKNHCLMDKAVASSPASPVFLRSGESELLTRLVIQPGVRDLAGVARDLFYVGTNRGRVLRIATDKAGLGEVLEEIQVFPSSTPVLDLVLPSLSSSLLIVVSADRVHSLPLVRCNLTSCAQCLAPGASPHCAWHLALGTCAAHRDVADKTRMTQSLTACPVEGSISFTHPFKIPSAQVEKACMHHPHQCQQPAQPPPYTQAPHQSHRLALRALAPHAPLPVPR